MTVPWPGKQKKKKKTKKKRFQGGVDPRGSNKRETVKSVKKIKGGLVMNNGTLSRKKRVQMIISIQLGRH